MKNVVYYGVVIVCCVASVLLFFENLNLTAMSAIPIFLMALSAFQIFICRNERSEAYGSNYNESEKAELGRYMSASLTASVPLHIPFILFFSSGLKFLSIIVYLLGLFGGPLLYILKNGRRVSHRLDSEAREAEEQKRREELGRMK